ncbi:MAG: hypothetical protein K6G57_02405 [Lachnospiraceae bacterium]|nr:hypothetical protein [Lachnospiraceae bacterium]
MERIIKKAVCALLLLTVVIQASCFDASAMNDERDVNDPFIPQVAAPVQDQNTQTASVPAGVPVGADNEYYGFAVPTQVYQFGGLFYLADAYNNQVIQSNSVSADPKAWKQFATGLNKPHAIASDGMIYVIVDTDNNRVVTYTSGQTGTTLVEVIDNVGIRPHYIEYDSATGQFYVWSSMTGTMYIYKRRANGLGLVLQRAVQIPQMAGQYTRSFTIDGNIIYFPSMGSCGIYAVNKNSFGVQAFYPVDPEIGGMVQIVHAGDYFYLSTSSDFAYDQSKANFVRALSPALFTAGSYEQALPLFGGLTGVPYYITKGEDGHYYTPVLGNAGSAYICKFDIYANQIMNSELYTY